MTIKTAITTHKIAGRTTTYQRAYVAIDREAFADEAIARVRDFDMEKQREVAQLKHDLRMNEAIRKAAHNEDIAGLSIGNLVADAEALEDSLSYHEHGEEIAAILAGNPDRHEDHNHMTSFVFEGTRYEEQDDGELVDMGEEEPADHWADHSIYNVSSHMHTVETQTSEAGSYTAEVEYYNGERCIEHGETVSTRISVQTGETYMTGRPTTDYLNGTEGAAEAVITVIAGVTPKRKVNKDKAARATARALKARQFHGIEFVLDTKGRVRSKLVKDSKQVRAEHKLAMLNKKSKPASKAKLSKLERMAAAKAARDARFAK